MEQEALIDQQDLLTHQQQDADREPETTNLAAVRYSRASKRSTKSSRSRKRSKSSKSRIKSPESDRGQAAQQAPQRQDPQQEEAKVHVLVVDDYSYNLFAILQILGQFGLQADTAMDGRQAI